MTTAADYELGSDGPTTLVVGVDGTDTSWRALYYTFGLARRQHATVLAVFAVATARRQHATVLAVLAVTTPIALGWTGDIIGAITEANDQLTDELKLAVQTLAADYRVRTEFIARAGSPVDILAQVAREQHADALIVGASQSLIHHLLRPKAIRAVRRCRCPVTVVP